MPRMVSRHLACFHATTLMHHLHGSLWPTRPNCPGQRYQAVAIARSYGGMRVASQASSAHRVVRRMKSCHVSGPRSTCARVCVPARAWQRGAASTARKRGRKRRSARGSSGPPSARAPLRGRAGRRHPAGGAGAHARGRAARHWRPGHLPYWNSSFFGNRGHGQQRHCRQRAAIPWVWSVFSSSPAPRGLAPQNHRSPHSPTKSKEKTVRLWAIRPSDFGPVCVEPSAEAIVRRVCANGPPCVMTMSLTDPVGVGDLDRLLFGAMGDMASDADPTTPRSVIAMFCSTSRRRDHEFASLLLERTDTHYIASQPKGATIKSMRKYVQGSMCDYGRNTGQVPRWGTLFCTKVVSRKSQRCLSSM